MKRYCNTCKKLTESSEIKKIKIRKISFHVCLNCGNPYEYKSFKEIANILLVRKRKNSTTSFKAGTSAGTYKLYLCTDHWKKIRKQKLTLNPICEFCKKKIAMQVHHLRYNDDDGKTILYREKMSDLLSVCRDCHKKIHK